MYISQLHLRNYRNYRRLDLDLPRGPFLFFGANAQGKTNLLESIHLTATTRVLRAGTEAEVIRWGAAEEETPPVARVVARVERRSGRVQVEVSVVGRNGLPAAGPEGEVRHATKRLRVNGVPKRASQVVGQVAAVLFSSDDLMLIGGPPALRRRYLDVLLSQVEPSYLQALQRYGRVLQQRNHLLKRLLEGLGRTDELAFWDDALIREGSVLVAGRAKAVEALSRLALESQARLSGGAETLEITYEPRLEPDGASEPLPSAEVPDAADALAEHLRRSRRREIRAGMSLVGPHRDDVRFVLNGHEAGPYASRGQKRSIALSLRLAEAGYLEAHLGEKPVLLLDDVLSELDEPRRRAVLAAINGADQAMITTTDLDVFGEEFLAGATLYRVEAGQVTRAAV
jgi:DNA replication and repair protein RecF